MLNIANRIQFSGATPNPKKTQKLLDKITSEVIEKKIAAKSGDIFVPKYKKK